MIWTLKNLLQHCKEVSTCIEGAYIPARPINYMYSLRIKAAWLVLRGEADAVIWPKGQ